jgi:uncharacterized OB-fold protein
MAEPVAFMQQVVALDYAIRTSPTQARFAEAMAEGRIVGQRCPSCGLVYVPPKGFCPMCVVQMGAGDAVEVADHGTVTSFTVLTPIQYRGQRERERYALASLLLDGADSTVGQQRIGEIPLEDIRTGMRVKAVWRPEAERRADASGGMQSGMGDAIEVWVPTGEPDADRSEFQEHIL